MTDSVQIRRDGEIAGVSVDDSPVSALKYSLVDVIAAIDEVKKPTIAALHGTPLCGGLEITLDTTLQPAAYLSMLADEVRGFASLAEAEKKSA